VQKKVDMTGEQVKLAATVRAAARGLIDLLRRRPVLLRGDVKLLAAIDALDGALAAAETPVGKSAPGDRGRMQAAVGRLTVVAHRVAGLKGVEVAERELRRELSAHPQLVHDDGALADLIDATATALADASAGAEGGAGSTTATAAHAARVDSDALLDAATLLSDPAARRRALDGADPNSSDARRVMAGAILGR
jgi:hypothetical protein